MKAVFKLTLPAIALLVLFICAKSSENSITSFSSETEFYTEEAKTIFDNKCYGCHSAEGKNPVAKKDLRLDELESLSKKDKIGKLDEIIEVLEEGAMPPAKIIKKYPDMKLTEEETKTLREWAENTSAQLME